MLAKCELARTLTLRHRRWRVRLLIYDLAIGGFQECTVEPQCLSYALCRWSAMSWCHTRVLKGRGRGVVTKLRCRVQMQIIVAACHIPRPRRGEGTWDKDKSQPCGSLPPAISRGIALTLTAVSPRRLPSLGSRNAALVCRSGNWDAFRQLVSIFLKSPPRTLHMM
jgi:hypothetical protein